MITIAFIFTHTLMYLSPTGLKMMLQSVLFPVVEYNMSDIHDIAYLYNHSYIQTGFFDNLKVKWMEAFRIQHEGMSQNILQISFKNVSCNRLILQENLVNEKMIILFILKDHFCYIIILFDDPDARKVKCGKLTKR